MADHILSALRPSPVFPAPTPQTPQSQEAHAAAKEFEAMFLTQSFEQSFKTLPESAFGGGHAGETWRHFLAKSIADEVAESGRTGIADWLVPQIERAQALSNGGSAT